MDTYRPNDHVRLTIEGASRSGTVTGVDHGDTTGDGPMVSVCVGDGVGHVRVRAIDLSHVRRSG
jgi:hypothetical protein